MSSSCGTACGYHTTHRSSLQGSGLHDHLNILIKLTSCFRAWYRAFSMWLISGVSFPKITTRQSWWRTSKVGCTRNPVGKCEHHIETVNYLSHFILKLVQPFESPNRLLNVVSCFLRYADQDVESRQRKQQAIDSVARNRYVQTFQGFSGKIANETVVVSDWGPYLVQVFMTLSKTDTWKTCSLEWPQTPKALHL